MKSKPAKRFPQWLGRANNPNRYKNLIDDPASEGYQIRQHVIFPVLFRAIHQAIPKTNPPMIDFGSGTGSLTAQLAAQFDLNIEGIDASRNFINLASTTYPHLPFYAPSRQGSLPYGLHNANVHLVLHCTPQPERLLSDIVDTVEPNGYVFVTIPHPDYFKASQVRAHPEKDAHLVTLGDNVRMMYYHRSVKAYEHMFRAAGLHLIAREDCLAAASAPTYLTKYKEHPYFIVYTLQKRLDTIDTALITHSGSRRLLLLTRAFDDDKFPGAKSLFSVRRSSLQPDGPTNLARGLQNRLGINPQYISPTPIGSLLAKHQHAKSLQLANVNLFAVKISGPIPTIKNNYYAGARLINPGTLRPCGGACTQLGYEYIRSHS